jgi:hypothetical protein
MNTLSVVIVALFVFGTVAVVGYALFEVGPFAHHEESFHARGERQQSPRLD